MTGRRKRARLAAQSAAVAALAFLFVVLVWRVAHTNGGVAAEVARGERPVGPAFSLARLSGRGTVDLGDYSGRVVVSFFASWCGPCKSEAPGLERSWHRWRDDLVTFVGIDVRDFAGDARSFVKRFALSFAIARDRSESTAEQYGVDALPSTFVVSPDGRVVANFVGYASETALDDAIARALRAAGAA
jgi:peroxiredoxin